MAKKEALVALKSSFEKQHVLIMSQLCKILGTTSRATVFRYLKELGHLSSYTHNGIYYTLRDIAEFDQEGFWYYGDIGFSFRGTLIETLNHVIAMSESGKTNSELEKHFRTRVQNSLQNLLKVNKITKVKPGDCYIYVSPDHSVSVQQIKKRLEVGERKRLPDWIVGEILIETIRSFPLQPEIDDVVKRLTQRGSLITRDQVVQVFEENNLQKKTLD